MPKPAAPPVKTAAELAAEREAAAAAEAARLEQERLAAEAERAAARAALEREESSQRLLLCTPSGPLVARIYITIDGQPFRAASTKRVDELLAALDADGDGAAAWTDAFENEAFAVAQFQDPGDARSRMRLLRSVDIDRDGNASRNELLALLGGEEMGAPDFALAVDEGTQLQDRYDSHVWRLLDLDEDGTLSAPEFLAAFERLKSRDADDDDLLYPDEVNPYVSVVDPQGTPMMEEQSYGFGGVASVLQLGFDASWPIVRYTLDELYRRQDEFVPEDFALTPGLFAALDADGDGSLLEEEFVGLAAVPPHLELEAHFGRTGDLPTGISLGAMSEEVAALGPRLIPGERGVTLELAGVKLRFLSSDPGPADYQAIAAAQLAAIDANSDGYLEESELPEGNPDPNFSFAALDANGDGKVYPDELAAYIETQQTEQLKQIRATSAGLEDALYSALDTSNDGRLNLRELADAARRLAELDRDGDDVLLKDDIPASIAVSLSRGANDAMQQQAVVPQPAMVQPAAPAAGGPAWFVRMDSNGDGDVSPREFLGDDARFRTLDTDADGFIDRDEAEATELPVRVFE